MNRKHNLCQLFKPRRLTERVKKRDKLRNLEILQKKQPNTWNTASNPGYHKNNRKVLSSVRYGITAISQRSDGTIMKLDHRISLR